MIIGVMRLLHDGGAMSVEFGIILFQAVFVRTTYPSRYGHFSKGILPIYVELLHMGMVT